MEVTPFAEDKWHRLVGGLIASIGRKEFPERLSGALSFAVPFDWLEILLFPTKKDQPVILYDSDPGWTSLSGRDQYIREAFLEDPFYLGRGVADPRSVQRLKDLASIQDGIAPRYEDYLSSIGVTDELAYLIRLPGVGYADISLIRNHGSKGFSRRDCRTMKLIEPVICAAFARHWSEFLYAGWLADDWPQRGKDWTHLLNVGIRRLGDGALTPREREVVGLILRGYSSQSIGKMLGISAGTARIHRSNVYEKLEISSQGELFTLFLCSLFGPEESPWMTAPQLEQ